ncbi:MAG: helix-turn-helix transcriptional regulator [Akkermansiaceae bacterium]|nr:helix-turn-helix transcriptional regulator [Akkermansiaceae bacterium]
MTMHPVSNLSELPRTTLGLYIRDKRMALSITLRSFAKRVADLLAANATEDESDPKFSPGFLSDIENGRRFPSERVLTTIAQALGVDVNVLREQDQRIPAEELQRLQMLNPQFGFAFRRVTNYINQNHMSPQELVDRICREAPPDSINNNGN